VGWLRVIKVVGRVSYLPSPAPAHAAPPVLFAATRPASGRNGRLNPALAGSQWTVSWLWHVSTNFAMRAARVSGLFASWTR